MNGILIIHFQNIFFNRKVPLESDTEHHLFYELVKGCCVIPGNSSWRQVRTVMTTSHRVLELLNGPVLQMKGIMQLGATICLIEGAWMQFFVLLWRCKNQRVLCDNKKQDGIGCNHPLTDHEGAELLWILLLWRCNSQRVLQKMLIGQARSLSHARDFMFGYQFPACPDYQGINWGGGGGGGQGKLPPPQSDEFLLQDFTTIHS